VQRILRRDDLLAEHAAARVERDPETDRHALGFELRNLLRFAVFVEHEIVGSKIRHEPAVLVGHRHGDIDELHARAKREALSTRPFLTCRSA
jgi:hypothetical protein